MENKGKINKLQHAFNFEDLYNDDDSNASLDNSDKNLYELNPLEKKERNSSKSSDKAKDYDYKKKLTKNSKLELLLRILLISLGIIFVPLSFMVSNSFERIEALTVFKNMKNFVSKERLKDNSLRNFFFIIKIIQDKDFLLGIATLLYILFHPFISLKIIFSSGILYFFNIVMKTINQSKRPLWGKMINDEINDIIECETSFSSPCDGVFFLTLYFIYSVFCIKSFYSRDKTYNINKFLKIFLLILYFSLIIVQYFYLLLYKLNYLHEIVFTNMMTLMFVCVLIDLDKRFQKQISNATKNIYKTRKNKLKYFLYIFSLFLLGILIYNFILPNAILLEVIGKLSSNEACSEKQMENLGMRNTFLNLPYILSMLGAFWGACLTIEKNPGEWWYQPLIIDKSSLDEIDEDNFELKNNNINSKEILFLIIKSIITLAVYAILLILFNQIPYISFEFNIIMGGIKYFFITFICFGILPIIFGLLHMNKKVGDIYDNFDDAIQENKDWTKNIFAASLFIKYQEITRYPYIHFKRN